METQIKVILNVELKGATRVRDDRYEWINYEIKKKDISNNVIKSEANSIVKKGRMKHYNYNVKPVTLHVNICKEAYDYMTEAVNAYRKTYQENYTTSMEEYAQENYKRAYKRVQIIIDVLNGKESDTQ